MEVVPAFKLEWGKTSHERRGFRSTKIVCGLWYQIPIFFKTNVLVIIPCGSQILFHLEKKKSYRIIFINAKNA